MSAGNTLDATRKRVDVAERTLTPSAAPKRVKVSRPLNTSDAIPTDLSGPKRQEGRIPFAMRS